MTAAEAKSILDQSSEQRECEDREASQQSPPGELGFIDLAAVALLDCLQAETIDASTEKAGQPGQYPLIDPLARFLIADGVRRLQFSIGGLMRSNGFSETPISIPEKLALIHSEISEALEAYRDNNLGINRPRSGAIYEEVSVKPEGVISELADAVIRIIHLADLMGADLAEALIKKHNYNCTRPYRHGGKQA